MEIYCGKLFCFCCKCQRRIRGYCEMSLKRVQQRILVIRLNSTAFAALKGIQMDYVLNASRVCEYESKVRTVLVRGQQ